MNFAKSICLFSILSAVFCILGATNSYSQANPEPKTSPRNPNSSVSSEQNKGTFYKGFRAEAHRLPFLSVEKKTNGRAQVWNSNPIVFPNPPRMSNLMSQYDGFRFRAPAYDDVYIMLMVSMKLKNGINYKVYSVDELPFEPEIGHWSRFTVKPGVKMGSFVGPEEGMHGVALRIPSEALESGKQYMLTFSIYGDGNNLNKEDYPGYVAIRAVSPMDVMNRIMFGELFETPAAEK